MHVAIRAALATTDRDEVERVLLDAWRKDKTSELADAIEVLCADEALSAMEERMGDWATTDERPRIWEELTAFVATLEARAPDPRVARALLRGIIGGPSDHWFRVDQVGHIAGPFPKTSDAPSFADRALALVERHADRGTRLLLEKIASVIAVEADCNGAEMVDRLRALATRLSSGDDVTLSLTTRDAICAARATRGNPRR